jgi:hypothetical protein
VAPFQFRDKLSVECRRSGSVCSAMVTPPEITWQVITSVSGGTATLTTEGNKVLAAVNKAGSYSLRATSGSILSNVTLSVTQVLTKLSTHQHGRSLLDPAIPLSVSTTTSRLAVQALDQFENPLTSLPSISWSTVLAPSGGTASTVFSSGIATVTFQSIGQLHRPSSQRRICSHSRIPGGSDAAVDRSLWF